MYIALLQKDNLSLAQAEAQAIAGSGTRDRDVLLLSSLPQGLALSKSLHEVLWSGNFDNFSLPKLQGSFAARSHKTTIKELQLAKLIWQSQEQHNITPKVDLKNPENVLTLFKINNTYYLANQISKVESYEKRKSHNRKHNHPTSLHPKLARAMINLTGKTNTILDPFCGAGGILLEGLLINKEMLGTDIDPIQLKRAEDNLQEFNLQAMLSLSQAENCAALGAVDAIVTDLPLGRNAKLPTPDFTEFFVESKKITRTMVLGALKGATLDVAPWTIKNEFEWYIHKTMTKRILVLE